MSSKNQVTLTFAGDSTSLDRTAASVGKSLDGVKAKSEEASSGFGNFNEGVEKSTSKFRGSADLVDGFTASLQTFGINIPGDQVIGFARGMADLADGFSSVAGPAIEKLTEKFGLFTAATEEQAVATDAAAEAQEGLDAAESANPLGLIIAAVAAVAVGFYELYQHSETFRNILSDIGDIAEDVFGGIEHVVNGTADAIADAFRWAFNLVSDAWNNTVGQLNFSIPGWVPGIGGDSFGVPQMPHFANGGQLPGGFAVVGERGPEIIAGTGTVIPNTSAKGLLSGGGQTQVVLSVQGNSDDFLVQAIRKYVRVNGGNVQGVLGR